jgi:preprotein translocase subunit SecA
MFGQMMKGIAQDLVRYVMHVQVQVQEPAAVAAEEPKVQNVQYSQPDDSGSGGGMAAAARSVAAEGGGAAPAGAVATAEPPTMTPTVKSDWDKTPRNAPCPCGSGKKFKLCHGKA